MKKTDVFERLEAFVHVGLLVNEPPEHRRVALYLVLRQFRGGAPLAFTTARPPFILRLAAEKASV